jgi:predicted alpha/beta-fold hydrolase
MYSAKWQFILIDNIALIVTNSHVGLVVSFRCAANHLPPSLIYSRPILFKENRMTTTQPAHGREQFLLEAAGQPALALQLQRAGSANAASGDVVYVHGSTFGSDLSVFLQLDGRSWADAMCEAGFNVWGFDFAGYGASARYPADSTRAVGRMAEAAPQLQRVVAAVRARNGARPVALVSHSWGASVACDYAGRPPSVRRPGRRRTCWPCGPVRICTSHRWLPRPPC